MIVGRQKPENGSEERRGVECVGVVVLAQHAAFADAVREDVLADLVRRGTPRCIEIRGPADLGELGRTVEGDPAHQFGRHVVLRLSSRFPDALVGLAPHAGGALRLRLDDRPQAPR